MAGYFSKARIVIYLRGGLGSAQQSPEVGKSRVLVNEKSSVNIGTVCGKDVYVSDE